MLVHVGGYDYIVLAQDKVHFGPWGSQEQYICHMVIASGGKFNFSFQLTL